MNLKLKCLPYGALPYKNETLVTRMMVRLFEKTPYLPFLPQISKDDNVLMRTIDKLPGISVNKKKLILNIVSPFFPEGAERMDKVYNNPSDEGLEYYSVESPYREKYFKIIERTHPTEAIIHFLGPFTFSQMVKNIEENQLLADKFYRKYIIQALTLKALWFVRKVKNLSPDTTPLIVFEENKLNEFGIISKAHPEISRELVISLLSKIVQTLKGAGAAVCVQCFNKCDWQIPLEAGINVLSFNAYTHPANITIIPDKITKFLEDGGYINWGIVPVMTESMVKSLTTDFLVNKFMRTVQGLVDQGVKRNLIYSRSMVSVQGEFYNLPLIFAEKALMLSTQLADKVFKK